MQSDESFSRGYYAPIIGQRCSAARSSAPSPLKSDHSLGHREQHTFETAWEAVDLDEGGHGRVVLRAS